MAWALDLTAAILIGRDTEAVLQARRSLRMVLKIAEFYLAELEKTRVFTHLRVSGNAAQGREGNESVRGRRSEG